MAGRLITSGPNKYSRPKSDANSILSASQFVTEFENEQQKIKEKKKLDAEKAKQDKALKQAQNDVNRLKTDVKLESVILADYSKVINDLKNSFGPPPYDAGELALLNPAVINFTQQQSILSKIKTRLTVADNLEKSINNQLISSSQAAAKKEFNKKTTKNTKDIKKPGKGSKPITGATDDAAISPPTPPIPLYTYNAPMVRSAYFRSKGPQSETTSRGISDAGNYTDAKNMYTPIKYDPITGVVLESAPAAKGTIQMYRNRYGLHSYYEKKENADIDSTMYGFKFLYNPTEVSMGWGIAEGVNPDLIQSGADGYIVPIGAGLNQSTVDFTLLLNRIGDMAYLDSNGRIPGADDPYPGGFNKLEDLKMIYKKGTMYDLEYLFRTINGPNASYQSSLNDKTADRGFLLGAQVELHLGDGLRYLVRIGSLSINHTVFNDRMVPILSNVQISCHRFYDPPKIKD